MKKLFKRAMAVFCAIAIVASSVCISDHFSVKASEVHEWEIYMPTQAESIADAKRAIYWEKNNLEFQAPQNVSFENLAIYMRVTLEDKTAVAAMESCTVELAQEKMDVAELEWSLKETNLQVGENEVYLNFNEAQNRTLECENYFDLTKNINYFRIYSSITTVLSSGAKLSELKLVEVDTTEAGLEFGKTDTYLQLSDVVDETPTTIEASIKMNETLVPYEQITWTIVPATVCNGSSSVTDRGMDGPDETWNVVEVNTQNVTEHILTQVSTPQFGEYTKEDIILAFWYYSYETEAANLPAGQLELRSTSNSDNNELHWNVENITVKPGWNYIELPLSCYNEAVGFVLNDLCQMRWYRNSNSNAWKFKLSDFRLVVKEAPKTSWTLYGSQTGATTQFILPSNSGTTHVLDKSGFSKPEGYIKEDLALAFWYYSYENSALPEGEIEITSSGGPDNGELRVNPATIQVEIGWNHIVVPLSDMIEHDNNTTIPFDVDNINYLRWYLAPLTKQCSFYISEIQLIVLDPETNATIQVTENVGGSSVTGNMIFSNTNTDDAAYALFVTEKGYPALLWGTTQFTLTQSVKTGVWVDIAAVYQENKVSFYIDGILADEVEGITLKPQIFQTKHCIGADGTGNNLMFGSIADIRLWSDARTAEEIREYRVDKKGNTASGLTDSSEGLLGNWFLYGDSQYILKDINDVCGNTAIYRGTRAEDWYDYDKNEHAFLGDDYWSLVFVPDIQNLTRGEKVAADVWFDMAEWIAKNVETENIQHVIGAGDTTWNNHKGQYDIAMKGINQFDGRVPFSNLIGNHDYVWEATYRDSTLYQNYFGEHYIKNTDNAISQLQWDYFDDKNVRGTDSESHNTYTTTENSYYRFEVNNTKWMILQLEYHPRRSVIVWADEILKKYPNDNVILATHGYIDGEGNYIAEDMTYLNSDSTGDGTDYITSTGEIWTELKDNSNIKFILCGHSTSDTGAITVREETNDEGRIVKALMINAQDLDASNVEDTAYYTDRPLGMLSILRFSEDGSRVAVQYYSPYDNKSFNPLDTVGSAERTTKDITMKYGLEPYIVSYQGATAGTAPEDANTYKANGYVFAGWYTDENCTKVLSGTKSDTVYAKYVHADMLSVRAQVRLDKTTNAVPADVTDMRFVTTVDTLKYQKVGFEIQVENGKINSVESNVVYKELYAVGDGKKEGEEKTKITYTPYDEFDLQSNYFNAFTVYNIPNTHYWTGIRVRPYWITMDGTTVYGDDAIKSVNQPNPQIVDTIYETRDVVIADYIPTEMGYEIDSTGKKDSTGGIQKALNDCYDAGGGTVYLPAGSYKITDDIYVPPFVTLRGDWQDPDEKNIDKDYGTIINVCVQAEDVTTKGTFELGGSAGVIGLTIYYPEQAVDNVQRYPYTFYVDGEGSDYMLSTISDVTIINGYRGIGTAYETAHEQLQISNVKGTFLNCGAYITNSAEIGNIVTFVVNNKYWANASGTDMIAADLDELATYTAENTIGLKLGDVEWSNFNDIAIDGCKIGIQVVKGYRYIYSGTMCDITVTNCKDGIVFAELNHIWGTVLARSSIANGITDNTKAYIKICDTEVIGDITKTNNKGGAIVQDTADLEEYQIDYQRTYVKPDARVIVASLANGLYTDAAPDLQEAIDEIAATGGGVVYVPPGTYRFHTPITVPAGVELRGSSSVATRDQRECSLGTIFLCYYGDDTKDSIEDQAFITLAGDNAGINGIRIIYPENGAKSDNLDTTYTVRGMGAGVYVVNTAIVASAYGVDFRNCDNHYIDSVMLTCYYNGFRLGGKDGILKESLLNGTVAARTEAVTGLDEFWVYEATIFDDLIDSVLRKKCDFIIVEDAQNQCIYNTLSYGAHRFLINVNSENTCATNISSDYNAVDAPMFYLDSGSLVGINILRSVGAVSTSEPSGILWERKQGEIRLYNPLAVYHREEENVSEADNSMIIDCDSTEGLVAHTENKFTVSQVDGDYMQGVASFKSEGANTVWLQCELNTAVNLSRLNSTGISLWLYINDPAQLTSTVNVELGSGGREDTNEYEWHITNVHAGWNQLRLRFADADVNGTPELSSINWLRIYGYTKGSITTKIDGVRGMMPNEKILVDCDTNEGLHLGSDNIWSINTTECKQGAGALQSTGQGTVWWYWRMEEPVNVYGYEEGSLNLWLYIEDVAKLSSAVTIELGSAGTMDIDEYEWQISDLQTGWNKLCLKFADSSVVSGMPKLSSVDWMRVYATTTEKMTTMIDDIHVISD